MLKCLIAVCIVGFPFEASAEWYNHSWGGAFDNRPYNIASSAVLGRGFAVRCKDESDLVGLYFMSAPANREDIARMNEFGFKLLLRVDDHEAMALDAFAEDAVGNIRVRAPIPNSLVEQLFHAKERLAVALSIDDRIAFEKSIDVVGSTAAMKKLAAACNLSIELN